MDGGKGFLLLMCGKIKDLTSLCIKPFLSVRGIHACFTQKKFLGCLDLVASVV